MTAPAVATRGRRWTRWRRAVQLSFALLFVALPFAASTALNGSYVALKLGPLDLLEPASALSALLAAREGGWTILVAVLPLVAIALLLGPVYCAWGCPFGLVSELVDATRQWRWRRQWTERQATRARPARFLLLWLLLVASLPLAFPLLALLAPPRLLTALPLEARAMRALPAVTTALLAIFLLVEVIGPRRFVCRVLCPAGALAALLRRRWTLAPRLDPSRCLCPDVTPCLQACPWAVDPRSMTLLDGCTTCLACVERCPSGALTVGARPIAPAPPSTKRVEEGLAHRRHDPEEPRHRGA